MEDKDVLKKEIDYERRNRKGENLKILEELKKEDELVDLIEGSHFS